MNARLALQLFITNEPTHEDCIGLLQVDRQRPRAFGGGDSRLSCVRKLFTLSWPYQVRFYTVDGLV